MNKPNDSLVSGAGQHRRPPVRVKVFRADGKVAPVQPPDGEEKDWWLRLNKALGTTSSDFVNASLFQIQSACRSPWGRISELSMNAALAMVEAAAPKDEIEGALAVQMACTHIAAMGGAHQGGRRSWVRAARGGLRLGGGSLNEDLRGSSRNTSTAAQRWTTIRAGRARPCERRWAGRHRQCETGKCKGMTTGAVRVGTVSPPVHPIRQGILCWGNIRPQGAGLRASELDHAWCRFDLMSQRAEGFKTKALLYERAASRATAPDVCRAYLDLARQLQATAKQTEALERTANLRQGIWWPEPVPGDYKEKERDVST